MQDLTDIFDVELFDSLSEGNGAKPLPPADTPVTDVIAFLCEYASHPEFEYHTFFNAIAGTERFSERLNHERRLPNKYVPVSTAQSQLYLSTFLTVLPTIQTNTTRYL